MAMKTPSYEDVKTAAKRISPYARHTPVLQSSWFNQQTGGNLFFKCENFQKVGAFKSRGACNAVFNLSENDGAKGIVTHSSGNHAQAVALASKMAGFPVTIVMPENAPKVKVNAVRDYGADIIFCESTTEAREQTAKQVIDETGAHFIHPYDHPDVIAGQGTCAKELMEEVPELDIVIAPVGGGGLISGTAISTKAINPNTRVIAAEPKLADDAYRSLKAGSIQPVLRTDTIADGLRTSLGKLPFKILNDLLDDIITVPEESIIRDMRNVWERMKIIIEPSCAVPVSAITDGKVDVVGKNVGIILTGGNVDLDRLPWFRQVS